MFPLVALSLSTVFEGYTWSASAILGLLLILTGNIVVFYKPSTQPKTEVCVAE